MWQTLGCQIAMWFKLFDWLRLFNVTAIYPILLREVLLDIWPFVMMMFIVLGLFGNGLYIFSGLSVYDGHGELFSPLLPTPLLDATVNNLLTMGGEYEHEKLYIKDDAFLNIQVWLWFLVSIIMTQIVFLNVLIAIISDTFDRVWEQRLTYILSSQADVLQDWLFVIEYDPDSLKTLYMYIITPTFQHDTDRWDGKISQIRKLIDRRFSQIMAYIREQKRQ